MCLAEILGMAPFSMFLALEPQLRGVWASVAGAELSARIERRRLVTIIMLASAGASVLVGLTISTIWAAILAICVVHSALISADSAALTSGMVAVSPPESRGTAMARTRALSMTVLLDAPDETDRAPVAVRGWRRRTNDRWTLICERSRM